MERQGRLCTHHGWPGRRARREKDGHDRRDVSEGRLHAICDSQGRPLDLFVTAGQVSDYIGARALLGGLPKIDWLLGDRGYDADWFREALKDKGIRACIPGRKQRKTPVKYDKRRYKRRNRIEIMFGRLKDWRRVATRYDRCPQVFLSAIAHAATAIYWLRVLILTAASVICAATTNVLQMQTDAASAICPKANDGKVPRFVTLTPDPCCGLHEWSFLPLRGGIEFVAHAAFFVLRARAARKPNSQDGLS